LDGILTDISVGISASILAAFLGPIKQCTLLSSKKPIGPALKWQNKIEI
jgi:hypothetical protein